MNLVKKIMLTLALLMCVTTSMGTITASASTMDEAVITQQDENYTPLYTTAPDSSLKEYSQSDYSSKDYRLFYTQTTLLALIAGYLILFKYKGINRDKERMHKRKK